MAIKTFAAIDVGSSKLSIKIFEVSRKYGIKEIDHLKYMIELGGDTYNNGYISSEKVNETCKVLKDFKHKMLEYKVTEYVARATSAVRESSNRDFIIEQIKIKTGINVDVISNSKERFLFCRALAMKMKDFEKVIEKTTAIVDVGAGSIQITIYDKSKMISTQNIKVGGLRVREMIAALDNASTSATNLIDEYIVNDINAYKLLSMKDKTVKNVIAIGDEINCLGKILKTPKTNDTITINEFKLVYQELLMKSQEQIADEYDMSYEEASLLLPAAMIYNKILEETTSEKIWTPQVDLCDGIVARFGENNNVIVHNHNFDEDIISTARYMSKKYKCNKLIIQNVEEIALGIFDCIRKRYNMYGRERLMLQLVAILKDCGKFISMNQVYENSYNIIMSTELIALSHVDREIIANVARYTVNDLPECEKVLNANLERSEYIIIAKLLAIARIANVVGRSQIKKINGVECELKEEELIIKVVTSSDMTLEQGLLSNRTDFFERIFGLKIRMK